MNSICILALALLLSAQAQGAIENPLPKCPDGLKSQNVVPPKIGKYGGTFEGKAMVKIIVLPSGKVLSALLVSSDWKPVGRHGSTEGAERTILEAVMRWKYEEVAEKCVQVVPIEVGFE